METIVGVVIIICALVILTILTVHSRRKINQLSEQNFPNAREAGKRTNNGE